MDRSYRTSTTLSAASLSREVAPGDAVPVPTRSTRQPVLLSAAARKAVRNRMLFFRQSSLDQVASLSGATPAAIKQYRHELVESNVPESLLDRGASLAFTKELPQGSLLYLLVRALRPRRVLETGVRPGYSTAWLLSGLEANGAGELVSLGPGPTQGRPSGVHEYTVGQFVPPSLRARWTLALGNTESHLEGLVARGGPVDLFLYDNGPDVSRARFELRTAWAALSKRGVLLAHHIDANPAFTEFCRAQGLPEQVLDPGPPALGALGVSSRPR
ncbi:MAG: class I SAM-dependent methyltransferase [Thermoplasmata archaeon]|nr:class I SAM-dependent methyltransferase [Thermoplasmata archaeon]